MNAVYEPIFWIFPSDGYTEGVLEAYLRLWVPNLQLRNSGVVHRIWAPTNETGNWKLIRRRDDWIGLWPRHLRIGEQGVARTDEASSDAPLLSMLPSVAERGTRSCGPQLWVAPAPRLEQSSQPALGLRMPPGSLRGHFRFTQPDTDTSRRVSAKGLVKRTSRKGMQAQAGRDGLLVRATPVPRRETPALFVAPATWAASTTRQAPPCVRRSLQSACS